MINFQKCTDKAYEILLDQHGNIPIKVRELTLDLPIVFDSLQNYSSITGIPMSELTANQKADNGFLYKHRNFIMVLHNEFHCKQRSNFTDGHELGHIVLGHKKDNTDEEIEANFFSAQILMPTALIKYLHQNNIQVNEHTLRRLFGVSKLAAAKKIITLKKYSYSHRWDTDLIKKYQDSLDRYLYLDSI